MNSNYILSLGHDQLWFNAECINRFSDYPFIQIFLISETKKLVIRPCKSIEPAAIPWTDKKQKARIVTCHIFYAQLCSLINYTGIDTLKICGTLQFEGEEEYLVFDLPSYECSKKVPAIMPEKTSTNISVIYLTVEKINDDYYIYQKINATIGGKTACQIMNMKKAI